MKRQLCILLAVCILSGFLSGCKEQPNADTNSLDSVEMGNMPEQEEILTTSFVLEQNNAFSAALQEYSISDTWKLDGRLLLFVSDKNGEKSLVVADEQNPETFHTIGLEQKDDSMFDTVVGVLPYEDGYRVIINSLQYTTGGTVSRYAKIEFDKEWNPLSEEDITEQIGNERNYSGICMTQDGHYLCLDASGYGKPVLCDTKFQVVQEIPETFLHRIITGADGEIYVQTQNQFSLSQLCRFDQDTCTLEPFTAEGLPTYIDGMYTGNAEYPVLVSDSGQIYGISRETGNAEPILHWKSSGLDGVEIQSILMLSEHWMLLAPCTSGNYLMRPRTQTEVDNMQTITIAYGQYSYYHKEDANFYNMQSTDCQIEIISIDQDELTKLLLAGNGPDLINLNCYTSIYGNPFPFETYANGGVLEDLTPYLESDPQFNDENYFMNFFDSMRYDGKLFTFGTSFYVRTYTAKSENLGVQGMTPKEVLGYARKLKSPYSLICPWRDATFQYMVMDCIQSYVDTETGECKFTAPEFIRILEYCKQLLPGAYYQSSDAGIVLSPHSYFAEPSTVYMDGRRNSDLFTEKNMTLVGYPVSNGGNGGMFHASDLYAINAASTHKQQAWDFLCTLLDMDKHYIPVQRTAAEAQIAASFENGDVNMTQKTMDYIGGISLCDNILQLIPLIVQEEADAYFRDEQTAEEAAEHMQKRVQLYLTSR